MITQLFAIVEDDPKGGLVVIEQDGKPLVLISPDIQKVTAYYPAVKEQAINASKKVKVLQLNVVEDLTEKVEIEFAKLSKNES